MRRASGAITLVLIGSGLLLHALTDNSSSTGGSGYGSSTEFGSSSNGVAFDDANGATQPSTQGAPSNNDWSSGSSSSGSGYSGPRYAYHSTGGGWSFVHSYSSGSAGGTASSSHSGGFTSSTSRGGFGSSASAHAGGGE